MTADRERLRVAVLADDPQRCERLAQLLDTLGFTHTDPHDAARDGVDVVVASADEHTARTLEHLLQSAHPPALVAWGEPLVQRPEVCGWLPLLAPTEAVRLALNTAWELSRARQGGGQSSASGAADGDLERLTNLATLGEAALQLNHDINNPLCSISLNAQLLLMSLDGRLEESALDKIRSIETNADRIRELTETLTDTKRRTVKSQDQNPVVASEVPA
jgi:signal transduction histidine kinase